MDPKGIGYAHGMLRSTVLTIASAINYGVAMATAAFVIHVATGGILPVPATMGLVLAAGGVYALCTAAVVQRVDAEELVPARVAAHRPAMATVTPLRPELHGVRHGRRADQPAIAFSTRPSSMSA